MNGEGRKEPFRFAIIGGGISGLTLAIAMHIRGLHVDIYEQAAHFKEIGAGVSFGPNAVQALELCSPDILKAFQKVVTSNKWPEKQGIWFTYADAYNEYKDGQEKYLFDVPNGLGVGGVHRANFLDEMVKLVPDGIAHFGKSLKEIGKNEDGSLVLEFRDATSAVADAVIGCDGIKSRVRQVLVGPDSPSRAPTYTHKYAYRGLIPIDKMAAAVGDDIAGNSFMHIGQDAHMLTFPVANGKFTNIVAFKTNPDPWPDSSNLTLPTTKAAALSDFSNFGPVIKKILELLDDNMDCWGIFDSYHAPLSAYNAGLVCLLGDAAHASSPHQGAGAGMGVEDAAVMSELLKVAALDSEGKPKEGTKAMAAVEAAFGVFDKARRERTQWLVGNSRFVGDLYEWRIEGVKDDFKKLEEKLKERCSMVWDVNVKAMADEAKAELSRKM